MSDPEPKTANLEKIIEKYPFLAKKWQWILLAILLIAGCFALAYYLWQVFKGKKETEKT